jgi:hypothetical protein
MKTTLRITRPFFNKNSFLYFLLVMLFACSFTSCSPLPAAAPSPTQSAQPPAAATSSQSVQALAAATTAEQEPTPQLAVFDTTYGITVAVQSLCTDGVNTTLYLETTLDAALWNLAENDFFPLGKTYFETSIVFLDNGELFSMYSSGKRDDPVFDPQTRTVSTLQTFVFPMPPSPGSAFTIQAKVTLLDLPSAWSPPVPMDFLEPGIIEIPMQYSASPAIGDCP